MTPGQAAAALAALPIIETLSSALAAHAGDLVEAIRAELGTPTGGPHDEPWRETGSLQDSISFTSDALSAQIGSNHPAAAAQELGTTRIRPRPFLAPAAASAAELIARDIGQSLGDLIARRVK